MQGFVINVYDQEDKTYREIMVIPDMDLLVSLEDGAPRLRPLPKRKPHEVVIHEREVTLLQVNVDELIALQQKQQSVAGMMRVFLPHADPTPIPESQLADAES